MIEITESTILDSLFAVTSNSYKTNIELTTVKKYINDEEYDTDALYDDLNRPSSIKKAEFVKKLKSIAGFNDIMRFGSNILRIRLCMFSIVN